MVNHLLVNINYMATLITDTLKQKGSGTFPLMNAENISLHSTSNIEKEIEPATDSTTGRIKIGDNIKNDNGKLSLDKFLTVSKEEPTDSSLLWIGDNRKEDANEIPKVSLVSKKHLPGSNAIELLNDGLYLKGTEGRIPNVLYINDVPVSSLYGKVVTCYTDTINGNDDTADGSAEKPFKTWNVAKSYLPKNFCDTNVKLYFRGDFSTLILDFEFYGAGIMIDMLDNPKFGCLRFNGGCYYVYRPFSITIPPTFNQYLGAISAYNGAIVILSYDANRTSSGYTIVLNGSSTANHPGHRGLYTSRGSMIQCTNHNLTVQINKFYQAVLAEYSSEIDVYKITSATNSNIGLIATTGGVIRYNQKSNGASTATSTGTGGRIYTGAQTSVGNY